MWVTVIVSALNVALGFIFRSIVAKFFFYFALYFFCTEALSYLMSAGVFPDGSSISSALASLSPAVWWGLDLVAFDYGFPLILGAYVSRFIIRMIPVVGVKG